MARNETDEELTRLTLIQRRLMIVFLTLLIACLGLFVAVTFSDIIRILSISVFVCYTAVGLVDWLERYIRSRFIAVFAVYVVGGIVTIISIIIVIPVLVSQIMQFVQSTFDQIPTFIQWCTNLLTPLERKLSAANIHVKPSEMLLNLAGSAPKPDPAQILSNVSGVAMSTMTWFFYGLSILLLAFYFLLDGPSMSREIVSMFPDVYKNRVMLFVHDMDRSLHSFFKGQIVLGLLFGAFMVAVYTLLGVPYALFLGIILGLWEIVPVIGPTVGIIPTVIAVLVQGMDHGPQNRFVQVVIVLAVFSVCQWLKDNIVAPKYIGNVIGLHPVVIFIAIMVGARLDGMLGIIVALPVACVVNVLIKHLRSPDYQEPVILAAGDSPEGAVHVSEAGDTKDAAIPEALAIEPELQQ